MSLSNEEYIRGIVSNNMGITNCDCHICTKENGRSFFSGESPVDTQSLLSNLKFGQSVHFDSIRQEWVVDSSIGDLVSKLRDDAVEKRFDNIEFALDEEGRPDGIKNKQEMVLTIASDIANSISELAFEETKQILEEDDWIDTKAMELLKESKEK